MHVHQIIRNVLDDVGVPSYPVRQPQGTATGGIELPAILYRFETLHDGQSLAEPTDTTGLQYDIEARSASYEGAHGLASVIVSGLRRTGRLLSLQVYDVPDRVEQKRSDFFAVQVVAVIYAA